MTQSVMLICPTTVTLKDICRMLSEQWSQNMFVHPDRCTIQTGKNSTIYVSIHELVPADEVRDEYLCDDDIPARIREKLQDTVFFTFGYNDHSFCGSVIQYLLSELENVRDRVWLDNDYGTLIPADTVLKELRANPAWDWRRYSPPPEDPHNNGEAT